MRFLFFQYFNITPTSLNSNGFLQVFSNLNLSYANGVESRFIGDITHSDDNLMVGEIQLSFYYPVNNYLYLIKQQPQPYRSILYVKYTLK